MTTRDSNDIEVKAGDTVYFGYGIPTVGVKAPVIERSGKLIALTKGHNPSECAVASLKKYVGEFWVENGNA
jgi:hypothetical protein